MGALAGAAEGEDGARAGGAGEEAEAAAAASESGVEAAVLTAGFAGADGGDAEEAAETDEEDWVMMRTRSPAEGRGGMARGEWWVRSERAGQAGSIRHEDTSVAGQLRQSVSGVALGRKSARDCGPHCRRCRPRPPSAAPCGRA